MKSDSANETNPQPSAALKLIAALLVGGLLGIIFLPVLSSVADYTATPDPADAFKQLTGWQLPPDAEILANRNTHGGLTNDGDYVLTVRLSPPQLQALLDQDSRLWLDCPVDPDIVRSAWELPDHSGKQYYARKTFDSDTDWHRGHIVITNPDTGYVWIYEWKGP